MAQIAKEALHRLGLSHVSMLRWYHALTRRQCTAAGGTGNTGLTSNTGSTGAQGATGETGDFHVSSIVLCERSRLCNTMASLDITHLQTCLIVRMVCVLTWA